MESRSIGRRRNPRWRRTQWLTSILGAAALLAAMGSGSVFAADPPPTVDDPMLGAEELRIGRAEEPIFLMDDPIGTIDPPISVTLGDPAEVEEPGQDPADVEDPEEVEDPAAAPTGAEDTPGTGLETRADGSVWWCPPTTGRFQLRLPCRMISPPTDAITGAVTVARSGIIGRARPIVADPETPDEPEDAGSAIIGRVPSIVADSETPDELEGMDARESDTDDSSPDQEAIADTESALPETDTDPAFSQGQMDPRTAALIALVLRAIAWGAAQRREAPFMR